MDKGKGYDVQPERGSKIRVISKAAIRYEGYLESADMEKFTLSNVCSFGTEGRETLFPIKICQFYDYVSFRAEFIDSVTVLQSNKGVQDSINSLPLYYPGTISYRPNAIDTERNSKIARAQRGEDHSQAAFFFNNRQYQNYYRKELNGVSNGFQHSSSFNCNHPPMRIPINHRPPNGFHHMNLAQGFNGYNNLDNTCFLNPFHNRRCNFNCCNHFDANNCNHYNNPNFGWRSTPLGASRSHDSYKNYATDYDFEEANKKFEQMRISLSEDIKETQKSESVIENKEKSEPLKNSSISYDKNKSFFDNVSNKDAMESQTNSQNPKRKQNTETFGLEFVLNANWEKCNCTFYNPKN